MRACMLCSCRLKKKMHGMGDVLLLNFITHCLCLASVNVQPVLVNVSGCQLLNVEEFSDTPFAFSAVQCQSPFCLPLSCFLSHNNVWWSTCGKVQPLLLYPPAVSAFVGQHNQIGGTAFRATLLVGLLFSVPLHACSSWNYLAMPCLVLSDILILN